MKRSVVIIGGVVVILLAVGALFGWETLTASAATTNRLQTTTVQRGTLVASVDAAGNVSAPEQAALNFQTSGTVAKVDVQVGDQVKKGQPLMELNTSDLQLALKSAQASLANAQANFDAAKAKDATNANQILAAKAAVDKAQSTMQQAQAAYDRIGGSSNPSIGMTSQSVTLQQATDDYQAALANYQVTLATINDTALRSAQAQLDTAQIAVEQAQSNLDKAALVAPFDGVISAVNYTVGQSTGGGTGSSTGSGSAAVTITNLSNLQIQVQVAEVDVPKVQVGETAQVTFDALPGKTYNAQVVSIDPVGTVTQGVVNYPVTVAMTDADSAVKPGMTANLAVTVDQRSNALILPLRAVRTQGNQKVVTVLYKGETIQVPVTTGLQNDQSVEVTSGLQVGDVVVLNQTTTSTGTRPGLGGGGIFFGGRGG